MHVHVKRVQEPAATDDGRRVLVDRLWPRGISRDAAALDDWVRDIAPSDDLRRWFGHDAERWPEFRRRYRAELAEHREAVGDLRRHARDGVLTLLYAAHDTEHNNARVLAEAIRRGLADAADGAGARH